MSPRTSSRARCRLVLESLEERRLLSASDYRTIDGTQNNQSHPQWGSTDERLLRKAASDYADGIAAPAGDDRPGARAISNALVAHTDAETPNDRRLTAYLYIWGQFLDHDLDLTGAATPKESFPIPVPTGDPAFDPGATGTQTIPLSRSVFDVSTGTSTSKPRQQLNQVTAWIDGSMIYGSDPVRAAALRTFSGGKLRVSEWEVGQLPPLNTGGLPNANDAHRVPDDELFLAGDIRANENIELTSLHTLFLREHNRVADRIARDTPGLSDEQIYQLARAWVIAEVQVITYKEWLPALLGTNSLPSYQGYKSSVDPGIANEFSTAVFRLHTTINDDVEFFDNEGRPIDFSYVDDYGQTVDVHGEVPLFEAFSNPTMFKQTGVDGILKYAASTHAEETDTQIVDSLRNFLFGQPGQGGLDLASLNIQRGRDHGLADYNSVRAAYGLPRVRSFKDITSDPALQTALKNVYGSVDNIDLWVGAIAEDHVAGASVGPLAQRVLSDQFKRLRDGDRFWYERAFSGSSLTKLRATTLADVIERNSDVEGLQDNVFFFKASVTGTVYKDADRDGRFDRDERGLRGATVELLNDEGEVVDSNVTGYDGVYRLRDFGETGDYQVRVTLPSGWSLTTSAQRQILISSGDVNLSNVNFGARAVDPAALAADDGGALTTELPAEIVAEAEPDDVLLAPGSNRPAAATVAVAPIERAAGVDRSQSGRRAAVAVDSQTQALLDVLHDTDAPLRSLLDNMT